MIKPKQSDALAELVTTARDCEMILRALTLSGASGVLSKILRETLRRKQIPRKPQSTHLIASATLGDALINAPHTLMMQVDSTPMIAQFPF